MEMERGKYFEERRGAELERARPKIFAKEKRKDDKKERLA